MGANREWLDSAQKGKSYVCIKCEGTDLIESSDNRDNKLCLTYPHFKCAACGTVQWPSTTRQVPGGMNWCGSPVAHWPKGAEVPLTWLNDLPEVNRKEPD